MPLDLPTPWSTARAAQELVPYQEWAGALLLLGAVAEADTSHLARLEIAHDEHGDRCAVTLGWTLDTFLDPTGPTTRAAVADRCGTTALRWTQTTLVDAILARWIPEPSDAQLRAALRTAARLPAWPQALRHAAWMAQNVYAPPRDRHPEP